MVELNGTLLAEGFPESTGCLMTTSYKQLADRHLRKITVELRDWGRICRNSTHDLHFRFNDQRMGVVLLRNADDPAKYRGSEYDWLLFDEITEATREMYDDAKYALRSSRALPFKSLGWASNPDGQGHAWVKKIWIEHDFDDEDGIVPEDVVFIRAMAWDNPTFDEAAQRRLTGFKDPLLVKSRWEGSWDLNFGSRFMTFNRDIHGFSWQQFEAFYGGDLSYHDLLKDTELFTIYASLDYGTSEDSASAWYFHVVDWEENVWTFGEEYLEGMYIQDQIDYLGGMIKAFEKRYQPLRLIYCDPALRGKDDTGISRWKRFKDGGIHMLLAVNDRIEGWASFDLFLHYKRSEKDLTVIAKPPRWRIHNQCKHLTRQIASAPRDEIKAEDVCHKFKQDHGIDSARYFIHSHFRGRPKKVKQPEEGSFFHYRAKRIQQERLKNARRIW